MRIDGVSEEDQRRKNLEKLSEKPGAEELKVRRKGKGLCLLVALGALVLYVYFHKSLVGAVSISSSNATISGSTNSTQDTQSSLAYCTSAAVIVLDMAVLTVQTDGESMIRTPGMAAVLMGLNRAFVLAFGAKLWFLGQSLCFAVLGSTLVVSLAQELVPLSTLQKATMEAQHRLEADASKVLVTYKVLSYPHMLPTSRTVLTLLTLLFAAMVVR